MAAGRRRVWKILGVISACLAAMVIVAVVSVAAISGRMVSAKVEMPVPVTAITIPDGDPLRIARGKYLVEHLVSCNACHAKDFGGRAEVDDAMIGTLWAPNLTTGKGSTVLEFTAVDWVRAIRHGVGKDGRRLVLMPSDEYYNFSDEDLGSIIAFIKSTPPVDREKRAITIGPLGKALLASGALDFAFDRIDHARPRPDTKPAATKEWGAVLIGACTGCHGATLSGGKFAGAPPDWPAPRNITPHETGNKGWTFEQFSAALRTGVRPDGTKLGTAMPWPAYAGMTDSDVQALYAYLMAQPPKPVGNR